MHIIPRTYCGAQDPVLPFVDTLIHDFFRCSDEESHLRRYEILKYRYGLRGQSELVLEDVGTIFGISRERVRQIERDVKSLLAGLLHDGQITRRNLNVKIQPDYLEQLTSYRRSLDDLQEIVREDILVEHTAACFGVINVDIPSMRLLLDLYGFKRIALSQTRQDFAWILGDVNPKLVQNSIAACFKYLRDEAIAKPFDEIVLNVNRRHKSKRIDQSDLELAIGLSIDIESVENHMFQAKYERLRSITDKIYRFLHAHGEPMHGQDIARRANSEAFKHGGKLRMDAHNVGTRLSADKRFVAIGRSGEWALAEWKVETGTVLSLMKDALHESGEPLTSDQIFDLVSARRSVQKAAIDSYLSYESDFVRVGTNLFALASWGMKSVSTRQSRPRKRVLGKAKLAEYIELIFSDLEVSEMYVSDLSNAVMELINDSGLQSIYGSVEQSPAVTVFKNRESKIYRRIARYNPNYRSLLTTRDILTKDVPLRQLIQHTVRDVLRNELDQTMPLSHIRDVVSKRVSCPKASVYSAVSEMDDIRKSKSDNKRETLCTLIESTYDYAHLVDEIKDASIKSEVERALRMLHVDTIDMALFQLGKIFENSLKHYILAIEANGQHPVTSKDKNRLFDMVNWAERIGLISDTSALNYLRLERNDRAHGNVPDLDERKAMLATAPQIVQFYLQYIILILGRIDGLS